jgi:hypothetical protein
VNLKITLKGTIKKEVQESCGQSIGIGSKPEGCKGCPYRSIGAGFVPDDEGVNPKIAMVLEAPGEDEALNSKPLVGRAGKLWLKKLIEIHGYKREDVLIANTLRCRPPGNKYPIGKLKESAELHCRAYDDKIVKFDPDLYLVTIHPAMLLRSSAMTRLVQRDLAKAFEFAAQGYRPIVLAGETSKSLAASHLHGGVKGWRGHWWEQRGWRTKY